MNYDKLSKDELLSKIETLENDLINSKSINNNLIIAEEALKESEGKYRNLIEMASDAIYLMSEDGMIIDTNQSAIDISGKEREEIVGHSIDSVDSNYPVHEFLKFCKDIPLNKQIILESTHQHKNGDLIPVELSTKKYKLDDRIFYYGVARDISERKRAEEALISSEEKYRTLVESSLQGMVVALNNPVRLAYASLPMETISGYSTEELEAFGLEELTSLIYPDDRGAFFKAFADRTSGKKVDPKGTYRIQQKDGRVRWVDLISTLIHYDNEPATQAVFVDITEQKEAENALKHSEAKHRSYVENAPLGIFIADGKGKYLDVNPGACTLLGYSKNELLQLSVQDISVSVKDGAGIQQLKKEGKLSYETELKKKDGSIVDVRLDAVNLPNNQFIAFCTDITERKQAEEALLVEKLFYELMVSNLPGVFYLISEEGKFLRWNTMFEEVTGRSTEEMAQISPMDLFDGEDKQAIASSIQRVFTHGQAQVEGRFVAKDGKRTPYQFSGKKIIVDGAPSLIGLGVDITERKLAKEKMLESEEKFREMADMLPQIVFEIDMLGNLTYTNKQAFKLLGYSEQDSLIGKSTLGFYIPDDRARAVENIKLSLAGNKNALSEEYTMLRKDGSTFDVLAYSNLILKENKSVGLRGVIVDVSEMKQAEYELVKAKEKVEESEEKFRNLYENSPFGIVICKMLKNEKSEYTDFIHLEANQSTKKNTGLELNQLVGKKASEMVDSKALSELVRKYGNVLMSGEPINYEQNFEIYNRTLEITAFPLHEDYFIISFINISERKQAETELITAKDKAEESDRLKSAFLANMSHEIRTPMNGILGFATLLKEPGLNSKKHQDYIQIIEKGGRRMLNIIDNIVSVSKIESGQMEVNIGESNINEQIEFLYTFFKPEVEAKGMQFSSVISLPSKKAILKTDNEKVYAILANLLKNAIKYTKKGSVEFGYNQNKNTLVFYVKDTGIGIPLDRQEAIFERFIQADIEDKMARQGAGLGLSISKAYVQMLGGKIWMESEEENLPAGKTGGSTFYFTIPYKPVSVKEDKAEKEILPSIDVTPIDKYCILIVEDDETSEDLLSIVIGKFAHEIIIARTGKEAVQVCQNRPGIDMILMDILLPEMDGYEATRQIRKFNKDVIIIAQTAYALEGDKEKTIAAGCDDYISKPIEADELKQLIVKYLKK